MVPFAGHAMPLQYEGIVAEHEWTRARASLFDVSHMGQILVEGAGAAEVLERLLPADLAALKPGHLRYSLLLDEEGGIIDDLIVTRLSDALPDDALPESFNLVVNGATRLGDLAHLRSHLPGAIAVTLREDRALLALQGPLAAEALDVTCPGVGKRLGFMRATDGDWRGHRIGISRSGYTGEDGFEISLPAPAAAQFADMLCADERVKPAGLGARDSLRLEAGLPLYGHDIDRSTDPVSAGLAFAISKRRREEGGFPGAETIAALLVKGPQSRLVGLAIEGRLPAREGALVLQGDVEVGRVTSGGFSPTLGRPIAMAYVAHGCAAPGTPLVIEVRGRRLSATVVTLPFVSHHYFRAGAAT